MKTEHIVGDILDFPNDIDIVVHGCNTLNMFGSGIAKQIKDRYPEVYEADTSAHKLKHNKLGYFSGSKLDKLPDKYIINLYIQNDVSSNKRMLNYEAIYSGFENLVKLLNGRDIEDNSIVVGFPRIGCGLAKGNWKIVKTMIIEVFSECKKIKKVVFVDFHK